MAADIQRPGHVSRARLFEHGSVLSRQLHEQGQTQPQATHPQAPAAAFDSDGQVGAGAQLTWPELWDARTTAGFVGVDIGHEHNRQKAMQLQWPHSAAANQGRHQQKRKHARLLHYSAVMARAVQRSSRAVASHRLSHTGQAAAQAPGLSSAAVNLSVLQPCDLFGPTVKRQRMEQYSGQQQAATSPSSSSAAWMCCKLLLTAGPGTEQDRSAPCGATNPASALSCTQCGAARWDGPDGQQHLRILAALQTADLNLTSTQQVAGRVLAESGRAPGVSQLPPEHLQAQVLAVLQNRQGAAARRPDAAAGGMEQLSAHGVGDTDTAGGCSADDELRLLDQHGCVPEAHGVYTNLLTWLQEQQQQQLPQQHQLAVGPEASSSLLQAAAATATALAPKVLAGALQQQSKLPPAQLAAGSILSWVSTCFEAAAAAAAVQPHVATAAAPLPPAAAKPPCPSQQQHTEACPDRVCPGLRRPLPLYTLMALCDRPGAQLRQRLEDAAAAAVGACGGRLPLITRVYSAEGCAPLEEEVPLREWMWAGWRGDTHSTRRLRGREATRVRAAAGIDRAAAAAGCEGGSADDDDLVVLESIESQDWEEVVCVQDKVRQLLSTWYATLLQQTSALDQQRLPQELAAAPHVLDKQLRQLLRLLVQQLSHSWGSAAPWTFRQGLRMPHMLHPTAHGGTAGVQQQRQQPVCSKPGQLHQAPSLGLSATTGIRRSARLQGQARAGQAAAPAAGSLGQLQHQDNTSSDDSKDSSQHGSLSAHAFEDKSCAGGSNSKFNARTTSADHQTGSNRQQADQREKQHQDDCNSTAALITWLGSLDDLFLPNKAGSAAMAAERTAFEAWQPGSGQWRSISPVPAAAAPRVLPCTDLPTGMQAVLTKAADFGVAPAVLQRSAARLRQLLAAVGGNT